MSLIHASRGDEAIPRDKIREALSSPTPSVEHLSLRPQAVRNSTRDSRPFVVGDTGCTRSSISCLCPTSGMASEVGAYVISLCSQNKSALLTHGPLTAS